MPTLGLPSLPSLLDFKSNYQSSILTLKSIKNHSVVYSFLLENQHLLRADVYLQEFVADLSLELDLLDSALGWYLRAAENGLNRCYMKLGDLCSLKSNRNCLSIRDSLGYYCKGLENCKSHHWKEFQACHEKLKFHILNLIKNKDSQMLDYLILELNCFKYFNHKELFQSTCLRSIVDFKGVFEIKGCRESIQGFLEIGDIVSRSWKDSFEKMEYLLTLPQFSISHVERTTGVGSNERVRVLLLDYKNELKELSVAFKMARILVLFDIDLYLKITILECIMDFKLIPLLDKKSIGLITHFPFNTPVLQSLLGL